MTKKKTEKEKKERPKHISFLITFAAFLPLFLILYVYTFDSKIFLGGDNAAYYILGKAISEGNGYVNMHMVGMPAANHFPPGYPVILGIYMFFFGATILGAKILNGILLYGSLILTYYIIKKISNSKSMAIIVTLLMLFNTHFMYYGSIIMSEIPFVFFFLLGVFLLLRVDPDKKLHKNIPFILLLLVIPALIYIRTIGITFLGATVCYFLIKRKYVYGAAVIIVAGLFLAPWQIRSQKLGGGSHMKLLMSKNPYDKTEGTVGFTDIISRVGNNTQRYVTKEIPHSLFPSFDVVYKDETGLIHNSGIGSWIFGVLLIALMIFGLIKGKNKKIHFLIGCIILFSFFILLLWPKVWFGIRFMLPLIPLLIYLMVNGLVTIIEIFSQRIFKLKKLPKWTPYLILLLIFTLQPSLKDAHSKKEKPYPLVIRHFFDMSQWCNQLPEDAIVVSRKPNLFYMFGNRTTCNFSYTADPEEQLKYFKEKGITHVVLDKMGYSQTNKYLAPFINTYSGKFISLKSTPEPVGHVFQFVDTLGYFGDRKDGQRTGAGTFLWPDGGKFVGEWLENKRNGYGELYASNGNLIKVNWIDDKKDGDGIILLPDSTYIKATWDMDVVDSIAQQYTKEDIFMRDVRLR